MCRGCLGQGRPLPRWRALGKALNYKQRGTQIRSPTPYDPLTNRATHSSIYDLMVADDNIKYDREQIRAFCETHGVSRLALFGSVLTDQFGPESDIDVLIDFLPDCVPGFFKLAALEADLTELFGHRKIDLRTPQDLSRHFRDEVLANAEVQYARE